MQTDPSPKKQMQLSLPEAIAASDVVREQEMSAEFEIEAAHFKRLRCARKYRAVTLHPLFPHLARLIHFGSQPVFSYSGLVHVVTFRGGPKMSRNQIYSFLKNHAPDVVAFRSQFAKGKGKTN